MYLEYEYIAQFRKNETATMFFRKKPSLVIMYTENTFQYETDSYCV